MCVGFTWIPIKQKSHVDKYMDIKGFYQCDLYDAGRAYLEDNYPTHGINFKMWNQFQKKGDSSCSNGVYFENTDLCFTYTVMS